MTVWRREIHAVVGACGLPSDLILSEEQADDEHHAEDFPGGFEQDRMLFADRAYDTNAMRWNVTDIGIWIKYPPMVNLCTGRKTLH